MISVQVFSDFGNLAKLGQQMSGRLVVGIQDAALAVQEIGQEKVLDYDAYDTFSLGESIYVSGYGYSDYEDRQDSAADQALNAPTKWPEIREWKLKTGVDPFLALDPELKTRSKYSAYIGVGAAHGKYVEAGYVSWFGNGNWIPARPFWAATTEAARPIVLAILWKSLWMNLSVERD